MNLDSHNEMQFLSEDVVNCCQTDKEDQQICQDDVFWEQKALKDFGISKATFRNTDLSDMGQRYLELYTINGGVNAGSEKFIDWNEFVRRAIHQDKLELIQYAINHGFNNYNIILEEHAAKGNYEPINNSFTSIPYYRAALEVVLKQGQMKLFNNLMERKPIKYTFCWDKLASIPLQLGNKELFDYIRSLAPTDWDWDWDNLATAALNYGNENLFSYVRSLAPTDWEWDWSDLAGDALCHGGRKLFDYIRSLAPTDSKWDCNYLADLALRRVDLDHNWILFNYIRSLAPLDYDWDWQYLACTALKEANEDLFNYIHTLVPGNYIFDWNLLAASMIHVGSSIKIIKNNFNLVYSRAPFNYKWDWEYLVDVVISTGHIEFLDYIFALAPHNYRFNLLMYPNNDLAFINVELFNYLKSRSRARRLNK